MQKATVNGIDLAYEISGDGEPVLLIHGAMVADAMRPLADHESLADHTVVLYHRRGYGESGGGPSDVPAHAEDARALLDHLGLAPAHVIGHSYGGSTAMQLASASPGSVRSLSLLEPGIIGQIPSAAIVQEGMAPVVQPFLEGKPDEAIDRFARTVLGRDYEEVVTKSLGAAALAQANADAEDAFGGDLMSLGTWQFGPEQAAAITCPVLVVFGADSGAPVLESFAEFGIDAKGVDLFGEMVEVVREWLPSAQIVELPGINHALQIADANKVAPPIASFLAKAKASA